jgi:hypothetical protein
MKLHRSDRRLLDKLNRGKRLREPIAPEQLERLSRLGLIEQTLNRTLTITARGQLELMRCRFSGLAKPRYAVTGSQYQFGFLEKLINLLTEPRQK